MRGHAGVLVVLMIFITLVVLFFPLAPNVSSTNTETGNNSTLTIWDLTDSEGGSYKVYAEGSPQGGGPNSTTTAIFFANYTNLTSGESINGSGVGCNVSFNVSGIWNAYSMSFNSSSRVYEYSRTFNSRGFYFWNVTCDGSPQDYDILNTTDDITVTNTPAGIYVPLGIKTCYEDSTCSYNFSTDCYDIDDIDENNLTYGYKAGTEFTGFSMNSTTGMVTVYIATDSDCGNFSVTLLDKDPPGWGSTADKEFNVNAINDKPNLGSVPSSSYQNSSFYYDIDATDEEDPSGPFYFNITFLSCYRPFNAQHSNLTNCSNLFVINHTTGVINRTSIFENYDVGNYSINFTVTDPGNNLTGTSIPPYTWLPNETDWVVSTFTVTDINDRPLIDPVANQFWTQSQNVTLIINASDIDNGTLVFDAETLYRNLSVYYNSSLFPITLNETFYLDNGTSLGNGTMNFTPIGNDQVGNYTVNISVYDGRANGTYYILVNFTVSNINDPPNISFGCKDYAVQGLDYYCDVEGNDPDDFPPYVPYIDPLNGTLNFELNFTYCNKTFNISDTNCSIFTINETTGIINYTGPLRKDSGNYTLNISVKDGGNLTDLLELNFTVVPDYPPNITTSVPPQSATQNQSFFLSVNATDLDNATDNLTFRTETYLSGELLNDTLFPIDTDNSFWPPGPAMGVMNYTPVNNSQVGNYTVKIIVNDTWSREDSILVNFTVWNINDPPALNFSCADQVYEDNEYVCNVGENTTDLDKQTPYGDNLTYNMTFVFGPPLFAINSTTGMINFTPANDSWANNTYNLTYVLNITVTDANGSFDWEEFNLTIHAVNDPPQFNFTNKTAWQNLTFFMNLSSTVTDEENNIPFYYNLTFLNCSKINVSDTNCSIFTINETTGIVNFMPVYDDIGNYTINVTVRDSGNTTNPQNATGWEVINFTVNPLNLPPSIDVWFVDPTNRSITENDSIIFFVTTSDPNGDSLACRWYKNGVLNRTVNNCQGDSGLTYKSGFEDSGLSNGTLNITLIVDDGKETELMWWNVDVANKNRPPYLYFPVQNQTWPMNIPNNNIDLDYHMRDPDNENNVSDDDNNLTFTYNLTTNSIAVSINPNTSIATLTPANDWYGIAYIIFTLNDSEFNLTSNNVTLNVTYVETEKETVIQEISGGGFTTTQTKIASLTITVVSHVRVTSGSETPVPVMFKNTGEVSLNDIALLAETSEKNDLSLSMSTDKISLLGVNQNATADLVITTHNLTKDSYEIRVVGSVSSPRFNQSTVIYLENLFANQTKVEEKIRLVKDLFEDNPECLDLTELILEAEKELGKGDLGKAKDLTETALQNCRDLIRYSANMTQPVVPYMEGVPVNEMIIALLIIGLFTIGAYYLISRRAERKVRTKKKREKERGTVIIRT